MHELPKDRVSVMGVLNATPDSFSDGGDYFNVELAIERGIQLFEEGADVVDVGGESTRPGAEPVPAEIELSRVEPIVEALVKHGAVSIDTYKAPVAARCMELGAKIINDVTGFRDSEMIRVARQTDAALCLMHMLGEPRTMQSNPVYGDVVSEVRDYLDEQAETLQSEQIARERIWIDPGIGFGKTLDHNLSLLSRLGEIVCLGYPVVVGVSRKSFIGKVVGEEDPKRRLGGSISAMLRAVANGARVVRVHDVRETVQALKVWSATC